MKKLTALLLALVMIVLCCGCSVFTEPKRGSIEGDVYKNETLDFEFVKPSSWVYSTDEEIAQAMDVGVELLGADKYKEALENSQSVFDMMVVDSLTATSVNVSYENLVKSAMSNITEEQYIDATKEQFANISQASVTFSEEYETVTLGKTEFTRAIATTKMSGITMTQAFYVHKVGSYMGVVLVTIRTKYTVSDIEAMFR